MTLLDAFARGMLAACLGWASAAMGAPITIGQVAPMTGLEALQGRAYGAGLQMAFDTANKAGIGGHVFTLVQQDDGGRPGDTVTATKGLLAQARPLALAGYFGNQNVAELLKAGLLDKEKVALVGYRVSDLRGDAPYLYSVRAGLGDELAKVAQHLATVGITRLGLLHEDGPTAPALASAMEEALKRTGQQLVARAGYPPGTADVTKAVETFVRKDPQAILMVATGAAAAGFIEQYRLDGGTAQLFAQSGIDIEQLAQRLGEQTLQGVAISQVTPSPYRISSRLAKEFADAAAARKSQEVPAGYAMMEGFIAGKVIVEAARRMGPRASREGFIAALESIDHYDMGGYRVGYKPGQRSGSRFVELSIVSASGRIRQ